MTDYLRYIRSSKEGRFVVQLAHQREEVDFVDGMPKEEVVKRLREMADRLEGKAAHSEADCDFLRGVTNEACDQHCGAAGVDVPGKGRNE
jgi:hypothetical protein